MPDELKHDGEEKQAATKGEPTAEKPPVTTIHEAELESGPSGRVLRGRELVVDEAVARRRAGQNVVVCGIDVDANRRQAYAIELAVGPCKRGAPHDLAGPHALPHYQPTSRPPDGHAFYETERRKSRKKQ
jgi:hypothetical protein